MPGFWISAVVNGTLHRNTNQDNIGGPSNERTSNSDEQLNEHSLDHSKTASTIAISIVHSKLDYCNFLFLNLDSTQIQRLQFMQNSLARAVTRPGIIISLLSLNHFTG